MHNPVQRVVDISSSVVANALAVENHEELDLVVKLTALNALPAQKALFLALNVTHNVSLLFKSN